MFHKQTDLTFHGLRTLQASANLQALEKLSKNIGRSAMKTQKAFEDSKFSMFFSKRLICMMNISSGKVRANQGRLDG